jgi:hypothetical protein
MNDDDLHALIRQTQARPEFPASFQREVWARIALVEQHSWAEQWQRLSHASLRWLARPAPAFAAVAVMLVAGVGLGGLTASDMNAAALRHTYFASINPLNPAHAAMQP